jgi:putative transcriptional regulator
MNKSYKGKILISTPDISGDIFSRSVVLIIEHDENGAFGMILNKKNDNMTLRLKDTLGYDVEIYEGGPVDTQRLFFIIKGNVITESYLTINNETYLTEDAESVIEAFIEGKLQIDQIKVLAGYSGWSAKQLETELKNNFWTPIETYNIDYTAPNDQTLWKTMMQNLGGQFLIWANSPEDVRLN